ncbi:mandelate racemase/muconate lactonizing enzyme family protein [Candidatus Acidianus copahuensis]|uniref:Mandelate racemase n=1 Tax=Candidatus Acidianus copahuensis TaxID=1160895 RepID=A0A031LQD3_9CREN|nr:mandelate racemase/muconate lactonizing enzyme family protein [Candidatus Acidianus copahuensis]EZQ10026.1 mandelate racemase [Candidatus Acidianus copahuensis]NON63114.1 mandelate racemase/muconate lactonizing enzyme family protein [Acidianus sp. RZ1]
MLDVKIRRIELFPVSIPYEDKIITEWKDEWGIQLYVKVEGDDCEGWGETLVAGSGIISAYLGVLNDFVIPFLKEVNSIQETEEVMEKALFTAGQGVTTGAISSVDQALWHCLSRSLKVPLYKILGGKEREKIKVYASLPRYPSEKEVIEATDLAIERGFTRVKLHQPPQSTLESLRKIRERIGNDIRIAVDLNSPFSLDDANKFINQIQRFDVDWIEEPLWPPNDYKALSKLTQKTDIAIAAGENEYSIQGFRDLIESGISIVQPDIAKIGGISKFLKVIALAESYNVKVFPHLRPHRSAIAIFHTLQVASARRGIQLVEFPLAPIPDFFGIRFEIKEGEVKVPDDIKPEEEKLSQIKFEKKLRLLKFSDLSSR